MKETIPLKTVTPLFIAGAEARGEPELRPPAFRGALHYWLRSLLGGGFSTSIDQLRTMESEVFGSSADDEGAASPVVVRLSYEDLPDSILYTRDSTTRVTMYGNIVVKPSGKDYLFWSMPGIGRQPSKRYFPENSKFDLVLSTRPGSSRDPLTKAVMAAWLLVHLGGIGSRSRHTGGGLSIRRNYQYSNLQFQLPTNDPGDVSTFLGDGLTTIRSGFGHPAPVPINPEYDILSPNVCRIWVIGKWDTSEAAINAIGDAIWAFRAYSPPDHDNVAKWLGSRTAIPTLQRAVFGLPIPYHYSGGGPRGIARGRLTEPKIERRAAPLWLKISKAADGKYVGIATLFKSRFLPNHEMIHAQQNGPPPIPPPPDYSIIERFISTKFPGCLEVHYV